MPSQDEITLAAKLVHYELVTREVIKELLKQREAAGDAPDAPDLGALLLERGLVHQAELDSIREVPLTRTQPIPDYRFDRKIAEGGMAGVWLATYLPISEEVALKVMKPELARQERFRRRFLRESKLLMKLDHENVVKGYEIRRAEGYIFCAMEHVDGATVEERIDADGPFDERLALYVTREVARALIYLSSRGVVHRDLKPGNILLKEDGAVKIIDLGLAKLRGGMADDGASGMTVGTVEYLSPEQARGLDDVDVRSDIYSLGVTLFHMIVGEVPFKGENNAEVIAKQVLQALASPVLKSRKVSAFTHYFIQKMMAKERRHRPQRPEDIIREIEEKAGDVSDAIQVAPAKIVPRVRPTRDDRSRASGARGARGRRTRRGGRRSGRGRRR